MSIWSSQIHGFGLHLHDPPWANIFPKLMQGTSRLSFIIVLGLSMLFQSFQDMVWTFVIIQQEWLVACTALIGFLLDGASSHLSCEITSDISSWSQNSTSLLRLLVVKLDIFMHSCLWHSHESANSTGSNISLSVNIWGVTNGRMWSRYLTILFTLKMNSCILDPQGLNKAW